MNRLESISSCNFVEIDGYAYFSNLFYNALFKTEIKSGKTFFLGSFEKEIISRSNIHFEVIQKEERIYFFPKLGRHMHIYSLVDRTMQTIEIRKESESFYWINEVVLNDDSAFFIPKQRHMPIKKMEWDTHEIKDVNNRQMIRGELLSGHKKAIPAEIIKKYKIRYGEMVSCRQMTDGKWYCFKPVGRQMFYFVEGTDQLESIPLTVVNEEELLEHIGDVKRNFFQIQTLFGEDEGFKLEEYLDTARLSDEKNRIGIKETNKCNVGEAIWKVIETTL